jgi:hypothetical protein
VNADGTLSLHAVTSTVSGSGDEGADPNMVAEITDTLGRQHPGGDAGRPWRVAVATDGIPSSVPCCRSVAERFRAVVAI